MNTTRNNHQPKLAAILISLVLLPSLMAAQATPNNSSQLSKKELKTISATRSNSTAQARLAEYYRDKARELTAKAQDFSAQAHALAKQPALNESKMGLPAIAKTTIGTSPSSMPRRPRSRRYWRTTTSSWQSCTSPMSQDGNRPDKSSDLHSEC